FNSTKPAIIVGNLLGGLMILRNDEGTELPREPAVSIFPNPYNFSNTSPLKVKSDRDVFVRFYNTLGQPLSENYFVPANHDYPINMTLLPAGVYIAQFLWNGKTYSRRFVVY
ncbi:MAG: T9SS type A sorting domain-containing protein, partial [Cytophagales bacterium]|nr:T9SS type A sorting domain-containing protein [Cytophagales bacterium]